MVQASDEWMFTEDLERDFKLPQSTWRYWHQTGRGPKARKWGRRLVWRRDEVEAFFAELEAAADAEQQATVAPR